MGRHKRPRRVRIDVAAAEHRIARLRRRGEAWLEAAATHLVDGELVPNDEALLAVMIAGIGPAERELLWQAALADHLATCAVCRANDGWGIAVR